MFIDSPLQGADELQPESWMIDLETAMLLGQIELLILHCRETELDHGPITPEGLWFLAIVQMLGKDATPGEVAKWMARKHNSTCGMMDRLEKKGLVEKQPFKKHGSKPQVRIKLTESGRQLYEAKRGTAVLPKIFSCLSEAEKRQFREALFRIRKQAVAEAKVYEEPPFPSPDGVQRIP